MTSGLPHWIYKLNPTLSPSFEIGQEWQYLPRWGAPNRGKQTWNCWWKSDLCHYFGIYPTTTHTCIYIYNMYTYWCDSLSLSLRCLPQRFFLKPWQLFHRPGERPSSMVAAMRPGRGGVFTMCFYGSKPCALVNIKIGGKWMFIP